MRFSAKFAGEHGLLAARQLARRDLGAIEPRLPK
jgi:hypothetical protein